MSALRIVVLVLSSIALLPACGGSSKPVAATPADAMAGWTQLGERWVDGKVDRDSILVGRSEGRFRVITVRVEESALEMFDIVIHFGDGTDFSPRTRMVFDKDTSSRVIDLPGGNRIIERVDFRYGNLPGGGRARVALWAR